MLPDHYNIVEVLHATRQSRVCLVLREGKEFIAKLPPTDNEKATKRFAREIKALQKAVGRHTVPIVDFAEDYSWYVMPRASVVLRDFNVPTSPETVLDVLNAIAESLRPLHEAGEVHRDLKPSNVLRLSDAEGVRWVVADFGIVRNPLGATTSDLTVTGRFLGTVGWAAPEQHVDAHKVTAAADVYASGLIAAWMLTGKQPQEGAVDMLLRMPMANAILRAVSPRPERRFQSIDELVQACKKELSSTVLTVESLLSKHDFAEILPARFIDPKLRKQALKDLARMSENSRKRWFSTDRGGIVEVLTTTIDGLVDAHYGIDFSSTIDPILIHAVEVLHYLVESEDRDTLAFAAVVYGGIADIHQYEPARVALDRMESLPPAKQELHRAALHQSNAWDFFSKMSSDRFPSKRKSPLLNELATSHDYQHP